MRHRGRDIHDHQKTLHPLVKMRFEDAPIDYQGFPGPYLHAFFTNATEVFDRSAIQS